MGPGYISGEFPIMFRQEDRQTCVRRLNPYLASSKAYVPTPECVRRKQRRLGIAATGNAWPDSHVNSYLEN